MFLLFSGLSLEIFTGKKMFVVDAEFLLDVRGKQYIKEFTLVEAQFNVELAPVVLIHELVRPPCSWSDLPRRVQSRCSWLTRHHHGHPFAYGRITLDELRIDLKEFIPTPGHVVFTKGTQKADILEEVLGYPALSLEMAPNTVDCDVVVDCLFEHSPTHCSKRKALFYARWLQHNPDQVRLFSVHTIHMY